MSELAGTPPAIFVQSHGAQMPSSLMEVWRSRGIQCIAGSDLPSPVLMWGKAEADAILASAPPPLCGLVAMGGAGDSIPTTGGLEILRQGGLLVSLTTVTSFHLDATRLFHQALCARFNLSDDLKDFIELSLGEAVSNGVMHGNLAISSSLRQNVQGLNELVAAMAAGIANQEQASKRLEITAWENSSQLYLAVEDDGAGFDFDAAVVRARNDNALHGRGLPLIQSLCPSVSSHAGGRKLVMAWPLSP